MIQLLVASLVFVSVLAGAMVGMWLRQRLPEHHRSSDSLDAIKSMTNMISVLAALMLGLLVTSVRTDFDALNGQVRDFGAQLVTLDNTLRDIGPSADPARHLLLDYTNRVIDRIWGSETGHHKPFLARGADAVSSVYERISGGTDVIWREQDEAASILGSLRLAIVGLETANHALRESAFRAAETLLQTRGILHGRTASPILPPLMLLLTIWVTAVFMSFGLTAPCNPTVMTAFVVCAFTLAACFYLAVEMDRPFDGFLTVSGFPLRDAVSHMVR